MGLIPIYFVVADYYKFDNTATPDFQAGTLVSLTAATDTYANGDAQVTKASASTVVIGVAGDSYKLDAPAHPSGYAADIVVGAYGGSVVRSQNKINDLYKETLGSGRMTVYTSGGKFATNVYAPNITFVVGQKLYSDASGRLTNSAGAGNSVGVCVGTPVGYSSGVPGTDTPDNSISLGTYLTFILNTGI